MLVISIEGSRLYPFFAHEIPAYFRVLARTDSKAQHMLGAASIDSDCSHAAQPVAKVDPVEHHHQDIELGEIAPQDLVDKSLGLSRPQSADSAFGKPLQLAFVQPLRRSSGYAAKHRPEEGFLPRFGISGRLLGRQMLLRAGIAQGLTHARPTDRMLVLAQLHLRRRASGPVIVRF